MYVLHFFIPLSSHQGSIPATTPGVLSSLYGSSTRIIASVWLITISTPLEDETTPMNWTVWSATTHKPTPGNMWRR